MNIIALIPARMGSSRFPGKPMAVLLGKPMIGHVYDRVRASHSLDQTVVATCDREISDYIESIGGTAIMTSDRHERASDRCAEALLIVEQRLGRRFDIAVMVQGDEPMTRPEMIDEALAPMLSDSTIKVVNLRAPMIAIREALPHLRAAGGGRILNVSSVAANYPVDGLMAYGISKIGLERLSVDVARQVAIDQIACNVFRIDIGVASQGFVANTPGVDHSLWEPSSVAAEGILWMLRQPISYSGQRESMFGLRLREGIMATQVTGAPSTLADRPIEDLIRGVYDAGPGAFEEPYADEPS